MAELRLVATMCLVLAAVSMAPRFVDPVVAAGNVQAPPPATGSPSPPSQGTTGPDRAPSWEAYPADGATILHPEGAAPVAARAATMLPALRDAIAAAFDADAPTDLVVRFYPDRAALLQDDPLTLAVGEDLLRGQRTRDLALVLPTEADRVGLDGAIEDALRVELVRHQLALRSEGRLPPLLAEGIASFVRRPREGQASGIAALRAAREREALPSWSRLMAPGAQYESPELHLPAARSVAHFLVETEGFGALAGLSAAAAETGGWREAFEAGVGRTPDEMEVAWGAWLAAYLDGGWRRHPLYPEDLRRVERLIAGGRYAQAQRELQALLLADPEGPLADSARSLSERVQAGSQAGELLDEATLRLAEGDYGAADDRAAEAEEAAGAAGLPAAKDSARQVADRARMGAGARANLERAKGLPRWRLFARRVAARRAYVDFAALGDGLSRAEAARLLRTTDGTLALLGGLPLLLGLAVAGHNLRRRQLDGAL